MRFGRKIKKALLALALAAAGCVLCVTAVACSKSNSVLEERYYVAGGDRFVLPQTEGEYYVTDPDGNEVEIVLGGFTADKPGEYKISLNRGGEKESSVLQVLQKDAVNFIAERRVTYASVHDETQLPGYEARLADGTETSVETVLISPSGEEIGKNLTAFTPEETGEYVLRATAAGQTDECVIDVGQSASYKNLLAPMDEKQSEALFVRRFGVSMSLNEEDSRYFYGTQKASMKVVTNMEANVSGGFQMTGFADPDLSGYNGFYFYVYNAGTVAVTMDINWMTSFSLKTGEWTRISVVDYNELCAQSGNSVVANYYSDKNINGILFNLYYSQGGGLQGMPSLELYFSDFYRMPELTPSDMNAYIEELPAAEEVTAADREAVSLQIEELETMYYSMSEYRRALVEYQKIADLKMRFLRLEYPDAEEEEDVIVYFDSELGLAQTDIWLNPSDSVFAEISDDVFYGDEGASTHIYFDDVRAGGERWDLDILVHTPAISDLSFGYDTYYMYVYNDSDNDALYYAWTDDSAGWVQPIYKGQWNLVYLTDFSTMSGANEGATRFNITNSKIVFAINPWNANAGASFYLSNVRALSERTVEDRLRADREDGEFLAETVRLYDILSASSKRNVENYDGLLAAMFNRTAERIAGDAVSADEEALQKIRGEIDLLDDVYKFATNAVKAAVEQNYRRIAPAYVDRFVSLYDARTADASLVSDMLYVYGRLNAAGRALVDRESFDAYYAGLTERFGVSGRDEIAAFSFPEGAAQVSFCIQSDTGVVDENWEKIFDYKPTNPEFVYTTERSYSTDAGSTRLTVPVTPGWDVLKMYLTMPSVCDLSGPEYDTLYFYVYNASEADYTLEVHYTRSFTLAKNSWTKVYIDDWANINGEGVRSDIRGLCFDIHRDWNLQTPATLYFSSVLPANADTVNALIEKLDPSSPDPQLLDEIRGIYEMLSDGQKALATGYRDVALAIMRDKSEAYGSGMTEAQKLEIIQIYNEIAAAPEEDELQRWYDDFYETFVKGVADPLDPKVFYCGYAYGFDQVSVRFDDAYGTYGDVIFPQLSLSDMGIYDENVSMRVTSDATTKTWASVYMTLKAPYLTSIDGEGIYTYVYNDMSHDVYALLWPNRFTLKAKSWNLLYLDRDSIPWVNGALDSDIDLDDFSGFTIELFYYNANSVTQLYDGLDLLFTPFRQATARSVSDAIGCYNDAAREEADRIFAAECAVQMYAAASDGTKSAVDEEFRTFAADYYGRLDGAYGVGEGDKIVGFDGEGGAKQIYVSVSGNLGSDVAYTESPVFSADRAYGGEAGSTRFRQGQFTTDSSGVWYTIEVVLSKDISGYGKIRFAVYNESTNNYAISLGGQSVSLASNQWTEVEFDLSAAEGEALVFKVECGNRIGRDALWLSAIYGI